MYPEVAEIAETLTLSEMLNPSDPTLARAMIPYHLNAMLKCMITALPADSALPRI